MFSYGIVMWELLTGVEPYADLHYGAIIGKSIGWNILMFMLLIYFFSLTVTELLAYAFPKHHIQVVF